MKNYKVIEIQTNFNTNIPATNIVVVEVLKEPKNLKGSKLEKFKMESVYYVYNGENYYFYTNNPNKYK